MEFISLVDSYKEDIIKSTQDIVRIKSIEEEAKPNMPFGEGPYKALKHVLNLSEDMGFKTKNFDNYVGHADLGQGDEIVGVLVHVDVVPEGDGWTYPPYDAEIHDEKIFGRGTLDDKGPAIAAMYAMKALKESGVKLNRKIRIIFGTNEETNWGCMNHYFKHEKAPDMAFTPDADFPVIHGEKGIINFDLVKKIGSKSCNNIIIKKVKGGNAPNMVADYCEAILNVEDMEKVEQQLKSFVEKTKYPLYMEKQGENIKIMAEGISAHGANPEKGKNAISYLMAFLQELIPNSCNIGKFINIYNEKIAFEHFGRKIGCGFEDDVSGKLSFNPGVIEMNDEEIKLTINVRYPIKSSSEEVYKGIRQELEGTGIDVIEGSKDTKPLYIPKDNFLVEKLMKVYREQTGDVDSQPITIGGGTYARAMENAVAFGPAFPGQEDVVHQKNEYISIEDLMKITKIYAHALYELAK